MSMPQIYLKVSSAFETASTASTADDQKLLKDISKPKKNIRERLNLHVKRRIQDQVPIVSVSVPGPVSQISQTFTSSSSSLLLSPTASISIHPANTTYHPVNCEFLRGNPSTLLIPSDLNAQTTSNLYNSNVRFMNIVASTIEQSSPKNLNNNKKTSPKRLNNNTKNRKKVLNSKDHSKMMETHNINLMLSPGSPSVAGIESMDKPISILNFEHNGHSRGQEDEKYGYEKTDSKLTNSQDILSMILAIKKNALMQDPEVIHFLSSLR